MKKEVTAGPSTAPAYARTGTGFIEKSFGPWNENLLWDLMLRQMPSFGLHFKHGRDCLLLLLCIVGFAIGTQWGNSRGAYLLLGFTAVLGTFGLAFMIAPYRLKKFVSRSRFGHELLASPIRNEDLASVIQGAFAISATMVLMPFVVCMAATGQPENVLFVSCVGLCFASLMTIGYWLVIGGHPLVVWVGTPVAALTGLAIVWTPVLLTKQMHICQASVADIWRKELFP